MAESKKNIKASIGEKICLSFNKMGTLRFYGDVHFAPGKFCGIELDDSDGDNDGSVNNFQYFKCKKNHGMFYQVAEVSSSSHSKYYVPSKGTNIQKKDSSEFPSFGDFSNINYNTASASETSMDYYSNISSTVSDISLYKEKTEVDYDSDESLGILQLESYKDEEECLNDTDFDTILHSLQFPKIGPQKSSFDDLSAFTENVFNTSDLFTEHITLPLTKENIPSFTEQDNLNITQVLQFSEDKTNLNISQALTSIVPKIFPVSKSSESSLHKTPSSPKYSSTPKHETNYTFILDEELFDSEKGFSPVSHLNKTIVKDDDIKKTVFSDDKLDSENILSTHAIDKHFYYRNEGNNFSANDSTDTKYLSSIKSHDTAALNRTVIFPKELDTIFELEANKTFEITTSDSCEAKQDEAISRNTLNTTISLSKELENKFETFNLEEKGDWNTKISDPSLEKNAEHKDFKDVSGNPLNSTISLSKELENEFETFNLEEKEDWNTEISYPSLEKNAEHKDFKDVSRNTLNTTISLSKELENKFEMFNLEEKGDCNAKISDHFLQKNAEHKDFNDVSGNTLNTSSMPEIVEKVVEEEKCKHDKPQILNSAFEKLDQLGEFPSLVSQVQKSLIKETKVTKLSKIARRVNSSAAASSSKSIELDKKKIRKSDSFSSKNRSTDALKKIYSNRRKTFTSTSSVSDDVVSKEKLSSNYPQRQGIISPRISDSQSLKTKTSLCNIYKKMPDQRKSVFPVKEIAANLVKSTATQHLKSTATQHLKSTATQHLKSTSTQPVKSTAAQPVKSTAAQHVKSTSVQSVKSTASKPVKCTAAPPMKSSAAPPVKSTAAPPVKSTPVQPMNSNLVQVNSKFMKPSAEISSHVYSSMSSQSEFRKAKSSINTRIKKIQLNETINLSFSKPDSEKSDSKKSEITCNKFSAQPVMSRVSKLPTARKSYLPLLKETSVEAKEHKVSLSGTAEKKILSPKNGSDKHGETGSINADRIQSLGRKDELSETSQNQSASSQSYIPAPVSKKKDPEEKDKTGVPKRSSRYNLR